MLSSTETRLCRTKRHGVPYVRGAPRGRPLQLPLFLHKRLVFSLARFNFAPSGPPFSKNPSKSLLNSWKGATSSPSTAIAGHKQYPLVLWPISKQLSTANNSKSPREGHGHHGKNHSANIGSQLCPAQSSGECQKENLSHQSHEFVNNLGSRIPPIVLPVATTKPLIFAASSKKSVPILRKNAIYDLLPWTSEQTCWQLKQEHLS